jgi:hypothetical protein
LFTFPQFRLVAMSQIMWAKVTRPMSLDRVTAVTDDAGLHVDNPGTPPVAGLALRVVYPVGHIARFCFRLLISWLL